MPKEKCLLLIKGEPSDLSEETLGNFCCTGKLWEGGGGGINQPFLEAKPCASLPVPSAAKKSPADSPARLWWHLSAQAAPGGLLPSDGTQRFCFLGANFAL